ncbi:hypothetical protein GGR58DRAFT_268380 [Xylaria digitata]|nr:hypothetical protein GGR58DRAFT_268380 [Xylaria digitata]
MPSSRLLAARPPRGVASSSNPSAQPNNGVVKQRRYHHTALDWGSKKQTIIQLYITENRRVEDVIKILKSEFAFNTSLRRFKQEIGKWGVRKNKERDAGGVRHAQEKAGEENSAVGLDDTVPETASLSSGASEHRSKILLKLILVLTRPSYS